MKEIIYKIGKTDEFSETEKKTFLELLIRQNKVLNPSIEKINRCKFICFCMVDREIISIGAIKPKTSSDFDSNKADLEIFRNDFPIELGYCYTLPNFSRKGYSSAIVKILLENLNDVNIMASTELRSDNSMIHILEKNGFKQYGKIWKSTIHNGDLGLFLKFVQNEKTTNK